MENKLQELTDRLYNEGLSKGKQEGEKILASAREEADRIVKQAKEEAVKITEKATRDAAAIMEKAASDVRMASEQSLLATRRDIENILTGALTGKEVSAVMGNADIIRQTVLSVASSFRNEAADMEIVLPESLRKDLEGWAASELKNKLGEGVNASFSKKIAGGFTIGPKDGSYFVSLTDETFKALICEYLRPVTKKLLFGE